MRTIGIKEFESFVKERLVDPAKYVGKTLVLWRAHYTQDSLAYRIIEQCCVKYNVEHADNQAWLKYSDSCFDTDDYTNIKECCDRKDMYGFKKHGILFNTGCFRGSVKDWLEFINTHTNQNGHISNDWPLIACAQEYKNDIYTEDQFSSNCEIYNLQPSVEEWGEWVAPSYGEVNLKLVLSFINKKGLSVDYFYLESMTNELNRECKLRHYESYAQMSEDEFMDGASGSEEPFRKEFFDYIHSK